MDRLCRGHGLGSQGTEKYREEYERTQHAMIEGHMEARGHRGSGSQYF
jgi:hypothetical protein